LRKWGGKLDYNCLIDSLEVFKSYLKRVKKEYTFEELFTKYAQATFLLYDGGGIGTGFFINSDGLAISNAHVLNHRSDLSTVKVYVWDSKGEVAEHRIWTVDKILKERYVGEIGKDDWVIFQIRKTESEKFIYYNIGDISKDPIRQGQEIAVLGNPKGKNGNFTNGTVNNIEGNLVTISADINLGNSGGPVINKFGEVIGIATWINNQVVSAVYENDFSKHNYAFNIQPVREVLNEIGVFYGGK
jgi:S1-C subfamily serine protease